MVLVAVLTAGLIGGGIAGVSQLASADQPELGGGERPTSPPTTTVAAGRRDERGARGPDTADPAEPDPASRTADRDRPR